MQNPSYSYAARLNYNNKDATRIRVGSIALASVFTIYIVSFLFDDYDDMYIRVQVLVVIITYILVYVLIAIINKFNFFEQPSHNSDSSR